MYKILRMIAAGLMPAAGSVRFFIARLEHALLVPNIIEAVMCDCASSLICGIPAYSAVPTCTRV